MAKLIETQEVELADYTFRWERYGDGSRLLLRIDAKTCCRLRPVEFTAVEAILFRDWENTVHAKTHPGLAQGI